MAPSIKIISENKVDREYLDGLYPRTPPVPIFVTIPGIVAPFLYDAVVAIGMASCSLMEDSGYVSGQETPKEEDNVGYNNITGDNLFRAFRNTSFMGTSGSIVIDPVTGTRDPMSALFSLTNFVRARTTTVDSDTTQLMPIDTDLFKSGDWVSLQPFTFNDGTRDVPADLPPPETYSIYLGTTLQAVGLTLCGIIVVLALGSSYWTYHFSKRRIVRSSQPLFLHLISAGTLLMGKFPHY